MAYKYHLLHVTRDLQMLSVIRALFLSKMGLQLAAGELLQPFQRKPWWAITQEQSVQGECNLQRLVAWLCLAMGLWVGNITTSAHTEPPK